MAATRSRKNLPKKYFLAIFLWSVISSPVIKSDIVVLKFKMISRMKTPSTKKLKLEYRRVLKVSGSKATSNGCVKQIHTDKIITTISQLVRNLPNSLNKNIWPGKNPIFIRNLSKRLMS